MHAHIRENKGAMVQTSTWRNLKQCCGQEARSQKNMHMMVSVFFTLYVNNVKALKP